MPNSRLDHPLELSEFLAKVLSEKCPVEGQICTSPFWDTGGYRQFSSSISDASLPSPPTIHPLPGTPVWDEAMPKWGCLDYHPDQVIPLNTLPWSYKSSSSIWISKSLDIIVSPLGWQKLVIIKIEFLFQAWELKVTAGLFFCVCVWFLFVCLLCVWVKISVLLDV